MINETVSAIGQLTIDIFDKDKTKKDTRIVKNLVVQMGKEYIASRMIDVSQPAMSHMSVGYGTTVPVSTNNELDNEGARVALTSSSRANNVVTYVATFDEGIGSGPITEAGIFNAGVDGTMLARTSFPVVNKGDFDIITITWSITIQ